MLPPSRPPRLWYCVRSLSPSICLVSSELYSCPVPNGLIPAEHSVARRAVAASEPNSDFKPVDSRAMDRPPVLALLSQVSLANHAHGWLDLAWSSSNP